MGSSLQENNTFEPNQRVTLWVPGFSGENYELIVLLWLEWNNVGLNCGGPENLTLFHFHCHFVERVRLLNLLTS